MFIAGIFQIWMLPPMAIFLGGWLFLGGYLFQKSLLKHTAQRRVSYGSGVLMSFLCGSVGSVPAALAMFVGKNLDCSLGRIATLLVFAVVGLLCFAIVGYMVAWTILKKESARTVFRVTLLPLAVIIALGTAVGVSCGIPAYFQAERRGQMNLDAKKTQQKLVKIHNALLRNFSTNPPPTLNVLVEREILPADTLRSSANPAGKGFFYYPPARIFSSYGEEYDSQLLACDFTENFDGEFYTVIYTYGHPVSLGKQAFKALLDEPINKEFAEAFRKADK